MHSLMLKGLKRTIGALLIALTLYSLLGFLILPGIALRIANQQLAQYATVPASLQRLQLNPFSLELSAWGLSIGAPGEEQLGFQRLYANLQLDSLWGGALHLATVELDRPNSQLLFDKNGQLNLTQLFRLPASDATDSATTPGEPLPLRIDSIALNQGNLRFEDLRPSQAIEFHYDDLNIELFNLSTLPEDNAELRLTARGPAGAQIDWNGTLSLIPLHSSGNLKVSDGRLKAIWPYVRDILPLELQEGAFNLSSDYRLDLSEGTQLQLDGLSLQLAPFAINDSAGQPLLKLASLEVSDSSLDLLKQQIVIGKVRSQQLQAWASREADGQLNWQKLLANAPASTATNAADTPATAPDDAESSAVQASDNATAASKPWQILLGDMQLRDYRLNLSDRVPAQPVALELGPLNLDLQDFDSLGNTPFTLRLDSGLGKSGQLQAEGRVQLSPLSASLRVKSQQMDLRPAQAYLSPFVRIELRSGLLGSDLAVELAGSEPLALNLSGSAQVSQLHVLDTLRQRDLLRWQQVDLLGLNYHHGQHLQLDKVQLQQPYARFVINEDLSTNLSELLIAQPAEAASAAPAGQPLAIHIGAIEFKDGSANFADFSLTPNFATAIQQMNGRIGTLDSQTQKPARVDITGKVDRYAPVSIKGQLNPFDPLDSLDIHTLFKQVELTTLTPYSGKFAGFRIRKGRLNLDLHYRISKGQLNAENSVVVEQLELGEKVDSPNAVDLPVRLAVALLKDTEGKISINLPVKGDLNNPEFSVMPIVWQTLRNLVLRAAQAPFRFIGGLVSGGSDVDLGHVPFGAGSSELPAAAQSTLDTLAKALRERPALRLEIEGMAAASDGPLLAEQRLQREFQDSWLRILQRRGETVPSDASLLQVPEDEQGPLLEGIYRTRLKQQPPAEWRELNSAQRSAQLREAVLQSWAQSSLLQRQLAQARAARIKDYLVDQGGLAGERIYLLDVQLAEAQTDGSVLSALHLDSD